MFHIKVLKKLVISRTVSRLPRKSKQKSEAGAEREQLVLRCIPLVAVPAVRQPKMEVYSLLSPIRAPVYDIEMVRPFH